VTVQKTGSAWFNEPDITDMTSPEQRAAALAVATRFADTASLPELIAMLGLVSETHDSGYDRG
jgi:hypothetical protein